MSPVAMGDIGDIGDTGVALGQALLCVTSLGCALHARQVTGGPAAGFLLQALAAATDALSPSCPRAVPNPDVAPGSWICSVLAQPLVAFGCHRLGGDNATANLLLVASVTSAAAAAAGWPGGGHFVTGHFVTGHFVTALTAASLLALAALTGSVTGAVAAALVALGDAVAPAGVPWVRVAASAALLGTLRELRAAMGGQHQ